MRCKWIGIVLATTLVAVAGVTGATGAGAATGSPTSTRTVKVGDVNGDAFPVGRAGAAACPIDNVPCAPGSPDLIVSQADAKGNATITLNSNTVYRVRGYVFCDGGTPTVSPPLDVKGSQLQNDTRFLVDVPTCVEFTVLGRDLKGGTYPFTNGRAGMMACTPSGCVFGSADPATGSTATSLWNQLDPAQTYSFGAFVSNVDGWGCGWVNPLPPHDQFWFSPSFTGTPVQADDQTFIISQPDCYPFTVVARDANGHDEQLLSDFDVTACPVKKGDCITTNGTGLDKNVTYTFTARTWDVPGWRCGSGSHYSEPFVGTPDEAVAHTFVITEPSCYEFWVFDEVGNPLPVGDAGMMACTSPSQCVFGGADATGRVTMANVDPNVIYAFGAFAVNVPGWTCGWVNPNPPHDQYWFSPSVTGYPAQVDGSTFYIAHDPSATC